MSRIKIEKQHKNKQKNYLAATSKNKMHAASYIFRFGFVWYDYKIFDKEKSWHPIVRCL